MHDDRHHASSPERSNLTRDDPPAPAITATDGTGFPIKLLLALLMGFASLSTDVYLPAMPTIARALDASVGSLELTISGYLVGFGLGQLFWGPVSDGAGRLRPLTAGLVFFVLGSAGCALAVNVESMMVCRVVQAFGASASVVLSRTMVRDIHSGPKAVRAMSTLMTIGGITPLLAPTVGGMIFHAAGWRAIFWFLVLVGGLTIPALRLLPETLSADQRRSSSVRTTIIGYGALLRHRALMSYVGVGAFFYAGIFAYVAGSPFAYISFHHVAPQLYGLLFSAGVIGIMLTNLVNGAAALRFGGDRLLVMGGSLATISSLALCAFAFTGLGGVAGLAVPLFVFVSATGFVVANSITSAMGGFPTQAGAVSALVGAVQYGSGVVGSALVGLLADGTPRPMAGVVAVAGLGTLACASLAACTASRGRLGH